MKWYKYDICDLTDEEYAYWYSLMNAEKQRRVDRFRVIDDKKRTVAGEMLARKAIAEWCSVEPESITFAIDEHGKPYAVDLNVEFNISHSGDMVVCAVDDNPLGIDIELIRPIDLSVAKRVCSDEELLYIFGHKPTNGDFVYTVDENTLSRFFQVWTNKEAFVKKGDIGIQPITYVDTIQSYSKKAPFVQYQHSNKDQKYEISIYLYGKPR